MRSSAVLAALLLTLASQVAPAQVRVGRDSSTRLNRFGRDLVYGTGLGLAYAEVDQLRNEPPQWGSGWEGYRRRAASNIGEFVIQEGVTEALAAAMHRPLDYTRCPCRGFGDRLGWVTDSAYYDGIAEQHKAEVMVIHLVLMQCRTGLPHLCLDDVERIIREAKPRLAIITHFGMTVWRAHPWEVAADLTQRIGTEVKAARDGMALEL